MRFSIKIGNEAVKVEGLTRGSLGEVPCRAEVRLQLKDAAEADWLFSELPRRVLVTGGGSSKSYRVKWAKVETTKFAGYRCIFSIEDFNLCPDLQFLESLIISS